DCAEQLKTKRDLNEEKLKEEIKKLNDENLLLKQQLVCFVCLFFYNTNNKYILYSSGQVWQRSGRIESKKKSRQARLKKKNMIITVKQIFNYCRTTYCPKLNWIHFNTVQCVKFSPYHYHNSNQNVICSSVDNKIRFWDFKNNIELKVLREHDATIYGIAFSPFNGGKFLFSGSHDRKIILWDIETFKIQEIYSQSQSRVRCIDIFNNGENHNSIEWGGKGYKFCSGSWNGDIRIWDIEKRQAFNVLHTRTSVISVKCEPNIGANTVLSGSIDYSVRLWDIRCENEVKFFKGHTGTVHAIEYSSFVTTNFQLKCNSDVICSGSYDNTIRFWDIRSSKKELYVMKGRKEEKGIYSIKFAALKKKKNPGENVNDDGGISLFYGSYEGPIHVWG
ncbi:WD repeat-containing protein, partial [Reticulomyxa filosa]